MGFESIAINGFLTVFSLGLLIISLISYKKSRNTKLVFVSMVFFVFFIKSIVLSIGIFYEIDYLKINPFFGFFDLTILILLFIATLKR